MSVKRYEVNGPSSVFEDENGSLVDYEDYAALEARCVALAAENAGLKQNAVKAEKVIMSSKFDYWSDRVELSAVVGRIIETPATEAFMAEVRASAVDSLVDIKTKQLADMHPDTHAFGATAMSIRSQINELQVFAAQLRKGVQS
ncbi:hypothetical protein POC97_001666 [Enterobacter hormaechei]|nr:hypothetical protein [Enterobacter hormaechei]